MILLGILLVMALAGLVAAGAVRYKIDPGVKGWR